MTTDLWRPLSEREAGVTGLRDGVPDFLEPHLRKWIYDATSDTQVVARVRIRLGMHWNPAKNQDTAERARHALAYVTLADQLLNVADAVLRLVPVQVPIPTTLPFVFVTQPQLLQTLLDDARSVYRVKPDKSGLMRRAGRAAIEAMDKAAASAEAKSDSGSAATHLRAAWNRAYSLHPEPDHAYSDAVKAVEAAAHAVIEPNNSQATLGTMKNIVKANKAGFVLALGDGDVGVVVTMMDALWKGQTSRHGAMRPTRRETAEEARSAVQIAVCLVDWFTTGLVHRAQPEQATTS